MTDFAPVDPEKARQATRRKGLGGSDAPAVLGLSTFKSPIDVWADKLDLRPKEPESAAMRWGKLHEPLIAAAYAQDTGRRIKIPYPQMMHHREHGWMVGMIDRVVIGEPRLVELKTAGWSRGWGPSGTDIIPDDYFVQVQHYLAVADLPIGDCAVLINGSDFRIYTIERNDALIEEMIATLSHFWHTYVLGGKPPPLDGSEACRAYIQARYPVDSGDMVNATPELTAFALDLRQARAQLADAEGLKRLLENEIKARMETVSGIVGDGFRITWKKTADGSRVDWEEVARALGADADLVRRHTKTTAGIRRFLVRFDDEEET